MSTVANTTAAPLTVLLDTERLHLRKADAAALSYLYNECTAAEGARLLGLPADAYQREKAKFAGGFTTFNKTFLFVHLLPKGSDVAIGWCGFHTWYTDHARAEIGYVLTDETQRGKGYMSEALGAVLAYGFRELGLHRIEAFVGPGNTPSLRLMERHGFVREGLLREHYFTNGRHEHSVVFGLLRAEWLQRTQGETPNQQR
ncbi:GNAT family protein [Flaviaesturariibacter amylovorans]|uniref:GNAT family protein n=1 Tax=Flaviaesturariibacter amylovorans TaxID=1084520 RepID=A0ABP8HUV5_9BACT